MPRLPALLLAATLAPPLGAQAAPDLGLPALPPWTPRAPRDHVLFADRVETDPPAPAAAGAPPLVEVVLDGEETGTGFPELFHYQLPAGLAPGGEVPMIVAYHGFGQSAASVATNSFLDEGANARGWIFLTVTGIDDQLYGAPIVQQNVEAAIAWMIDNHPVDPDRVYMAGFSMGAGIAVNFAARHRDPDGVMIAGVGTVAGTFDWIQAYETSPALQPWLEDELNFGGPPDEQPFAYQQASAVVFGPPFLPAPGEVDPALSMITNLHDTPLFMAWDKLDTVGGVVPQNKEISDWAPSLGMPFEKAPTAFTLDPNGQGAAHSWWVVDVDELYDFLEPHAVDRTPDYLDAQVDRQTAVSFVDVVPAAPQTFAYVTAQADPGAETVELLAADGAARLVADVDRAGLDPRGEPSFALAPPQTPPASPLAAWFGVRGLQTDPSHFVALPSGAFLVTDAEPGADTLLTPLPAAPAEVGLAGLGWTATLSFAPDPAPVGAGLVTTIDAGAGATLAYVLLGTEQALYPLRGEVLGVPAVAAVAVPLDARGRATVGGGLPADPALAGTAVMAQVAALDARGALAAVGNLQVLAIE